MQSTLNYNKYSTLYFINCIRKCWCNLDLKESSFHWKENFPYSLNSRNNNDKTFLLRVIIPLKGQLRIHSKSRRMTKHFCFELSYQWEDNFPYTLNSRNNNDKTYLLWVILPLRGQLLIHFKYQKWQNISALSYPTTKETTSHSLQIAEITMAKHLCSELSYD